MQQVDDRRQGGSVAISLSAFSEGVPCASGFQWWLSPSSENE